VSVRDAIEIALTGDPVPGELLEAAFGEIMDGTASPIQVAGLLVALRAKGETIGEIVAAARALRAHAVTAKGVDPMAIDTCGTGGDGANTFNISTAAAFVVAGAGVPVAKHGGRAATSKTGSIDVFEELGVAVDLPVECSAGILREVGIAPFFARVAHPAMKFVAPVRAELGVRTLMNCLGPLLNPMGVRLQLVGVYSQALVEPLAEALGELGAQRALVVHGSDGLDEITTCGKTDAAFVTDAGVQPLSIDPREFGLPSPLPGALRGGDAKENAQIILSLLGGETGARRDIVLLNAAGALWVAGAAQGLEQGLELARDSLDSGAARNRLERLVVASTQAHARNLDAGASP
jgi:anthranilate phosphoribosyltransferase